MTSVTEGLTNQITKLMCIKTRSRYSNCALPIVIIVALVVSKLPELILSQSSVIVDNMILGSGKCTASNVLSSQEEFKIVGDTSGGNNSSRS